MARKLVVLATSHGGHLELLQELLPAFQGVDRLWLTAPSAQTDALRRRGERVVLVPNPRRRPALLAANLRAALGVLRSHRPDAVVSPGANVAVPFCIAARIGGAPLLFVETMARVDRASMSGRMLAPLSARVFVQWAELSAAYPRAQVCRPALLEGIQARPPSGGEGTFVVTGSHGQPFDRLLELVDRAAGAGMLPAPLVVQGAPRRVQLDHIEPVARFEPEEVRAAIEASRVVVCHGGSGIISHALRGGRTPLVLPRRRAYREHVDDHQVVMTRRLETLGLAVSLETATAAEAVERATSPSPRAVDRLPGPRLVDALSAALADVLR